MRFRHLLIALGVLALAGCDSLPFLGNPEEPPLPGKRIPVLVTESSLKADPGAEKEQILLPPPTPNPDWPQSGGYADHAMHHIAVTASPSEAWHVSIGAGNSGAARLNGEPVVAGGLVYTMDSESVVRAFDAQTGKQAWSVDLTPDIEEGEDHIGGGLAVDHGQVFATTGFALVVALDAATGKEKWRRDVGEPMRAAPTVRGNRVFVITLTNKLLALSAFTGETLWTYEAIEEVTNLLGAAAPAVDSGIVVAPFSSGELVGLRVETGRELWSDTLAVARRASSVATLSAIRGRPVIDRGVVFALSNSGLMVALDLATGRRIWERDVGGIESPWVAGDYLFVLTNNAEVVALGRKDGRIHWVRQLPLWDDPEAQTGRLIWTGPILVSDRLIVAGSSGEALVISPYSGRVVGYQQMPDKVSVDPIVANETIYFLADDGELVAYR